MTVATAHPAVSAVFQAISDAMTGALADVAVLDAVDPLQAYEERSVTVGGSWDPDRMAVATDQTITVTAEERGAARRVQETVTVQCIAYTGSGMSAFPAHRASVGAILTAVSAAVRAVRSVDGVPAMMRVADQSWAQGADDKGSFVMAPFAVVAVLLP